MSEKGRVEAFSDGVFAIAITLLVLEIHVPEPDTGKTLWEGLGAAWPSYFAYVVGFAVIGVMWLNHHTVFNYLARVDRTLLALNLLLLLVIVAVPWAIAIVSRYLDSKEASVAVAVLGLLMTGHAITFTLLYGYVTRSAHLLRPGLQPEVFAGGRLSFALGLLGYPLLVGLAFVSAPLALGCHGLLALYYMFDRTRVRRIEEREEALGAR